MTARNRREFLRDVGRGMLVASVGAGTAPDTFIFGSNLWYALDRGADWRGPTYPSGIPPETGSIIQRDPAFLNRLGGDYHISHGSPAVGAGRVLDFNLAPDFDGWRWAVPPTIGAFELGPQVPPRIQREPHTRLPSRTNNFRRKRGR